MATPELEQLEKQIRASLEHDRRINVEATELTLRQQDNVITLEGEVADVASKRIAANLTRQLAGERFTVIDSLQVCAPRIGDDALQDRIVQRLLEEPLFEQASIVQEEQTGRQFLRDRREYSDDLLSLTVADGVATLTGQIPSLLHRRLAEALLWWVEGCRQVDNQLQVQPPDRDTDGDLADAVRMVLEKDPNLDAMQLHIDVHAGVVQLEGETWSEEQKKFAAGDVWAVPGVWEVYNQIHVGQRPH